LRIIDGGNGISLADQKTVFTRFDRGGNESDPATRSSAGTDPSRNGFGIGLNLAKWVVEEHGGTIALTSPPPDEYALAIGRGTMLTLTFPAPTALEHTTYV